MLTLLVLVSIACVFIKIKFPIGAAIYAKLDGPRGILRGVVDLRTHGKDRTGAHEERNTFEGRIGFDLLPACERFAAPEVVPCGGRRQVDTAPADVGFEHRVDHNGRAEHELVAEVPCIGVGAPVHHERALNGVVLARYLPGQRVDIRHQPVAKLVVVHQDGLDFVEAPQLVVRPVTVGAEDGTERAVLEPACVEFLERGIGDWVFVRRPIAADVSGPIWIPGQREIETGGNLVAQAPIGAVDVSRPDGGTNALLAERMRIA